MNLLLHYEEHAHNEIVECLRLGVSTMITLFGYYRSSATFRVRIVLQLKQLDFKEIPIHLLNNGGEQFSAEYRAINPQSLVPSLQIDGKVITQSLAIIDYLDELYPKPPLLPSDPLNKANVRSLALQIAADIHPLNNLRVLQYLTQTLGISEQQKKEWYQHWIAKGFAALETWLVTNQTAGKFCFGDNPTLADICLVPQIYNAVRYECDLEPYPTLVKIFENCQAHPAFLKAWPENVKSQ